MRTLLPVLVGMLLVAGCTRVPAPLASGAGQVPSPAGSPASTTPITEVPVASSGALTPDGWAIHAMPNVGQTIALPPDWIEALEIDEGQRQAILAADPYAAEHMSVSPIRLRPGRDVGLIAFNVATGTSLLVRLDGALVAGVTPYDAYVARLAGVRPGISGVVRSSMGPTAVAGRPAAVIATAFTSDEGTERSLHLTGYFGARDQPIEVSFRGLSAKFDQAEVNAIIASITEGPDEAIGEPLVIVEDRELDAVIRGLVENDEWRVAAGDLATLTGLGFARQEFFDRALDVMPELVADPGRFRGGLGWMASTTEVGLVTVHAVRILGETVADWDPLVAAVDQIAAQHGAISEAVDGEVRWWRVDDAYSLALDSRGTTMFLLVGTDRELLEAMIGRLREP